MKFKFLILLLSITFIFTACSEDEVTSSNVTFDFTFNWDGTPVTLADFNDFKYTNAHGERLSISKMRYLISNIKLIGDDYPDYLISGYNLVDLTNSEGLVFNPIDAVPVGNYKNISFTFGFDAEDNSESYLDLNSVNWNWPEMLGGGYHFMQYEGKFLDSNNLEQPYALHLGTARVSTGVFEQNYFDVIIGGVELGKENVTIEIKMNIAEWFKNPYQWDLNVYSTPLMPNYDAQILMNQNGRSVFSLGEITQ